MFQGSALTFACRTHQRRKISNYVPRGRGLRAGPPEAEAGIRNSYL
jgi:hypothetical protein